MMMNIGIAVLAGLALITIVIIASIIGIYNGLIHLKESIKKAWANIDVILKQRYDEIPKLVKLCEQYMQYEQATIDKIMKSRERMVQGSPESRMEASEQLSIGIRGLLSVGENYPELKANENFIQLQGRVSELEESLADRREYYNNVVNNFNIRIQQIPDVFVARFLGYTAGSMFEVKEHEREDVSVEMNIPK